MALLVEDGTGVANANSYVSVASARTWVAARGFSFTGTDSVVEQLLLLAMDLLETYRAQYRGSKTASDQSLQWPRTGATLDRELLEDDAIPPLLISAQIQLAYEAQSTVLQPSGTGQEVLKEKVGPIETEYVPRGMTTIRPLFNKANAFLDPLLRGGGGYGLQTLRA
jgi:hypothetical protein